jgi:hypothetical protein
MVDMRSGNRDGRSSMTSKYRLVNGPVVISRLSLLNLKPFASAVFDTPSGVGGGEVPTLFWSFHVICGCDWASSEESMEKNRY